jgi:hypothetical protein
MVNEAPIAEDQRPDRWRTTERGWHPLERAEIVGFASQLDSCPGAVIVTGPSGAGKTALLRWAAGYLEARGVRALTESRHSRQAPTVADARRTIAHLRRQAATGPLVLTIDDWQLLDGATQRTLAYVARRLPRRSGLLVACRTHEDALELEAALDGHAGARWSSLALDPPRAAAVTHRAPSADAKPAMPAPRPLSTPAASPTRS